MRLKQRFDRVTPPVANLQVFTCINLASGLHYYVHHGGKIWQLKLDMIAIQLDQLSG